MTPARGHVLIVDDNAALVDNLAEILHDAGFGTRTAGSCAAALAHASDHTCDVALVDVMLPDGSGIDLALKLKEYCAHGEIILLTGHATTESAAAAVRAGAFAYLVKPVATGDLLLTIDQAVAKVRMTTERRDLIRRANRAEKLAAVGTLAAGLSHEIRNPLNAALLQLTVLERRLKKLENIPATVFEPLGLVQTEIKRLSNILDEFLQFARPRELERGSLDVRRLAEEVRQLLQPQADAARVRLEVSGDSPPPIEADEARLKQAVINLAINAIQATPAGGAVSLSLTNDAEGVQLAVEDTGPGIPPEMRERVFEPFFTTKEAGSGLGLPQVHAVVQQHGGTLWIEDRAGGGARFVMSLPR
jgi:signal transduction histidine kinase